MWLSESQSMLNDLLAIERVNNNIRFYTNMNDYY